MLAALLALLATPALATIYTTDPVASSRATAGETLTVTWIDDGASPLLSDIGVCSIDLCIGSLLQQTCIQNLAESVDVSKAQDVTATIDPSVGEDGSSFFIRYTSENHVVNGTAYMQFSARFAVSGMTGNWTTEQKAFVAATDTMNNTTAPMTGSSSSSSAARTTAVAAVTTAPATTASTTKAAATTAGATTAPAATTKASGAEELFAPVGFAVAAALAGYIAL